MLSLNSMLLLLPPLVLLFSVLKLCLFHEAAQPKSVRSAWRSKQGQFQLQAHKQAARHARQQHQEDKYELCVCE
jgi:hypothetical protein